jgi:hypothetical protein
MAESRRHWSHHRVWLKCSKPVARQSQVLPVCAGRRFKKARKILGQAQAPSPVFFVEAPGRPVFIPLRCEGDGAPGGATISPTPCGAARALRGHVRHPALHRRLFCPRRHTSVGRKPRMIRSPGRLPPPVVAPASSHRRQPVIVPADDWPRPPGPAVTSRRGGRRILLRLQDRL